MWTNNQLVISSTGTNTTPFNRMDNKPANFGIGLKNTGSYEDYEC